MISAVIRKKPIKKFGRSLRSASIFALILVWVFSGWPQIFNFPPTPHRAHAAANRENGLAVLYATTTTSGGTNMNLVAAGALRWLQSDYDSQYFSHNPSSNPNRLTVTQAGDYLVSFTAPVNGAVTRAAERFEVYVNGIAATGTIGESTYKRNTGGHDESSAHAAVLLRNLSANDYIEVFTLGTGSNIGTAVALTGRATLYAEFIPSSRPVYTAYATTTDAGTNMNQTSMLRWVNERTAAGISHSTTSPYITLQNAGNYLVFFNMPVNNTDTLDNNRTNVRFDVQINGVTVPGGIAAQNYLRTFNTSHQDASAHWSGMLYSVPANAVFRITTLAEGDTVPTVTVQPNKMGSLYIERIPSTQYFFSSHATTTNGGGTNWNPASKTALAWNIDDIYDPTTYTRGGALGTHEIRVNRAGDYLLIYNDALTSTVVRSNPRVTVEVNAVEISGAQTKSHYIRNNAEGNQESSGSLVIPLLNLAPNDIITVSVQAEAVAGTVDDNADGLLTLAYKPVVRPTISISGTLYSNEGTAQITSGGDTLRIAIGTTTVGLYSTTTVAGTGVWRIDNIRTDALATGTPIAAWIGNNANRQAFALTKASSTSNNITGFDLYQNRIITKHEGTSGTSTRIADLAFYDGDNDPDIQFLANGGGLNIAKEQELHIWTGTTFSAGGAITIHGSASSTTDGSLHIDDNATLTAGGSITVAGHWDADSGSTFSANNNEVIFNATTTGKTITGILTGASTFASTTFNGANGAWIFSNNASASALTIAAGSVTAPAILTVGGNYANSGDINHNGGTIFFTGSGATLSGQMTGLADDLNHVVFSGSGTKSFLANASTTNVTILAGGVAAPAGLLSIAGNYSNSGTFTHNAGTTTLNGTAQQTFSGTLSGASQFGNLRIINTSGTGPGSPSIIFSSAVSAADTFTLLASTSVRFLAGATSTFAHVDWGGNSAATRIWLRSSSPGIPWGLAVTGEQRNVSYIDVADSNACSGNPNIAVSLGFDSFGNTCWDFVRLTQRDFQFFSNADDVQPGGALDGENVAPTLTSTSSPIRLRINATTALNQLATGTHATHLQYAFGLDGPWFDVGATTSSETWRFFNNPSAADGATTTAVLLSASDINESYNESNPSPSNPNAIPLAQEGEWDFALNPANATTTSYYFRMAKSSGASLYSYTNYPSIVIPPAGYTQRDYQFFDNANSVQPGVALAPENTPPSLTSTSTPVRLRMNITVAGANLGTSSQAFRLQYGFTTTGPWTDVGPGETWQFFDNPSATDGATTTATLLLASDVNESYEESNPTISNLSAIAVGQEGEWDFALNPANATTATTYYFQIIESGGAPLSAYTNIPSVAIPVRAYTQENFRWYENADALDPITPIAGENATSTVNSTSTPLRLRTNITIENFDLATSTQGFQAQYAFGTGGPWLPVGEIGSTTAAWRFHDNPSVAGGATTTIRLLTGTDVSETYEESNPINANIQMIRAGDQGEWDFSLDPANATSGTTYYFRTTLDNGAPLSAYSRFPATDVPARSLIQEDYRFYQNIDAIDPITALAATNTPPTLTSTSTPIRLRTNIAVGNLALGTSSQSFKLQYAFDPGGGWSDVGPSQTWQFSDNASVSDGATTTALLISTSDVKESYEESNPTAPNLNTIPAGQKGEWDFVLNPANATSTTYYFRMALDNGTPLTAYTNYPSVEVPPRTLTQRDYRWYENVDAVQPTTALAAENTIPLLTSTSSPIRLRVNVTIGNIELATTSQAFTLQYAFGSGGPWTDVGPAQIWQFSDNSLVADGVTLTSPLLSSSDISGSYAESNPTAPNPNAILAGQEGEWDFVLNPANATTTTYLFRLVKNGGAALDAYTNYARIRIPKPLSQRDYRWYENENAIQPTTPLQEAEENATSTINSTTTPIRLRTNILRSTQPLATSSLQLKLQYAYGSGGPWTDILNHNWNSCRTEGGTSNIAASANSRTITLNTPIASTTQAFLLVDSTGVSGVTGGDDHMVSGFIASPSTVTFERGASPATQVEISYTVVECFDSQFTVQRGEISILAGNASNTGGIGQVDTARSVILVSSRTADAATAQDEALATGELQDSTTVLATRAVSTGASQTDVRFEVITFAPTSQVVVRTGEITLTSGNSSIPGAISDVDVSRSWIYCSWDATNNGLQQGAVGCELTNNTTVTFYRHAASAYTNRIRYYVVEFPENAVSVQRGLQPYTASSCSADTQCDDPISISAISTTTKAFPFVTNTTQGTGTAFPRNKWIEYFTDNTTLMTSDWRGDTGNANADKYWQVMEFTGAAWQYATNTAVADGATTTAPLLSTSNVNESYAESNPTAPNPNALEIDQRGEWDFALDPVNATNTTYYFRAVESDNTEFGAYEHLPALVVTKNPFLSSAGNQIFTLGQSSTPISEITVTDSSSVSITAANDLRIAIATSTANMRWDTSDVTAVFGGTAMGKVSNPVSYEGGGSVLVIPVGATFAPNDTLTISGLSFTSFNAITASTSALHIYKDGAGDILADAGDTRTITIKGALALANHPLGQAANKFDVGAASDIPNAELVRFRLTPTGENMNISQIVFSLTDIKGFLTSNITGAQLYVDFDANGAIDGGDLSIGGAGTPLISGNSGTLAFSSAFSTSTTRDYILRATISGIDGGDKMTFRLLASGITASGATTLETVTSNGTVTNAHHIKIAQLEGGKGVGLAAPSGAGTVTGGSQGGGEDIGSEPGFLAPGGTGPTNEWTNAANAFISDGLYATENTANERQDYATFSFGIPGANIINGIEVKLEASATTGGGTIEAALSWNGGTSTTTVKSTASLTTSDVVYRLGGASDTWGRAWTPAEFSDANFRLRVVGQPSGNTVRIDAIQIRAYHQAGGGGGGGGGEL